MIVIKAIVELKMPLRKRGRTAYKETAQITGSLQALTRVKQVNSRVEREI